VPIDRRAFMGNLAAVALAPYAFASRADAQDLTFFRIGTGSAAGTYFPIGGIIASAISNPPGSRECEFGGSCGVPGLIAVVQSTQGSVENVDAVNSGRLDSGFCQADVAFWAYHASGPYKGKKPLRNLRAIANLYPEAIQLIVRVDSGIRRVKDLAGKRISLDQKGSGTAVDANLVLEAWDLSAERLDAVHLSPTIAIERLRTGKIDGLFLVAGTPTGSIADMAKTSPLTLVPITGPEAEKLRDRYPFFAPYLIQAGTYQSVPATPSLAVGAQWLVGAQLSDDLVYKITKALWHPNTRRLLDAGHPKGKQITFDTALNGLGVPLHPGARRYYEERGVTIIDSDPAPEE
jgi:TRAP transporter TAXI family solute receptor